MFAALLSSRSSNAKMLDLMTTSAYKDTQLYFLPQETRYQHCLVLHSVSNPHLPDSQCRMGFASINSLFYICFNVRLKIVCLGTNEYLLSFERARFGTNVWHPPPPPTAIPRTSFIILSISPCIRWWSSSSVNLILELMGLHCSHLKAWWVFRWPQRIHFVSL